MIKKQLLFFIVFTCFHLNLLAQESEDIQPYTANSWYWQHNGEPLVLFGGIDKDNLWQRGKESIKGHLDTLQLLGENFVRNTMSDRDPGNTFAIKKINLV